MTWTSTAGPLPCAPSITCTCVFPTFPAPPGEAPPITTSAAVVVPGNVTTSTMIGTAPGKPGGPKPTATGTVGVPPELSNDGNLVVGSGKGVAGFVFAVGVALMF